MNTEYEKTIEAVKFSIQMEIEGKKYYEKASGDSSNEAGKQLFNWLAGEEDKHRNRFEQIYDAISNRKAWPKIKFEPDPDNRAKNVFLETIKNLSQKMLAGSSELEIISGAMELEEKTRLYYRDRSAIATRGTEKSFYESLAAEEKGHYLALANYREYITDPTGFFTKQEMHSLDGA